MIKDVSLRNVKCFANQNFEFSKLNILTGINGVGKSTVIQSLLLAAQSDEGTALELNGDLVDIGDYTDLRHEHAPDDSVEIRIKTDSNECAWGYPHEFKSESVDDTLTLPLLSGTGDCVKEIKNSLVYICAERWGPRSNVPINSHSANAHWLGKHGEFTIQFLEAILAGTLRDSDGKSLSTTTDHDPRLHESTIGKTVFSNVVAWMGEISPNVNIDASVVKEAAIGYSAFSFGGSKNFKATNVGFGLSYALSIVTALVSAIPGATIILENPEAHLHPRGQSKLGKLMALSAKAGIQIIVETHSEHIINGARILVRKKAVPPSLMNIFFISRNEETFMSDVECLDLNEMGQVNNWPEGFFDQQSIDMKTLITGI